MKKVLLFVLGLVPLGLGYCVTYIQRIGALPLEKMAFMWAAPAAVLVAWILLAYLSRGLARTRLGAAAGISLPALLVAAAAAVQHFAFDLNALWGKTATEILGYFYAPFEELFQYLASLISQPFAHWQTCAVSFVALFLLACLGCALKRDRVFR